MSRRRPYRIDHMAAGRRTRSLGFVLLVISSVAFWVTRAEAATFEWRDSSRMFLSVAVLVLTAGAAWAVARRTLTRAAATFVLDTVWILITSIFLLSEWSYATRILGAGVGALVIMHLLRFFVR